MCYFLYLWLRPEGLQEILQLSFPQCHQLVLGTFVLKSSEALKGFFEPTRQQVDVFIITA